MKKQNDLKKDVKKNSGKYPLIIIAFICLLMISSSFAMLARYSGIIDDESKRIALSFVENSALELKNNIEAYKAKSLNLGVRFSNYSDDNIEAFRAELNRTARQEEFSDIRYLRYFKDGIEYDILGNEYDQRVESEVVLNLVEQNVLSCVGVVADRQTDLSACVFCVPIENNIYMDTLLVFYPVSPIVERVSELGEDDVKSIFTIVCAKDGECVKILYNDESDLVQLHSNVFYELRNELNNKELIDSIKQNIDNGTNDVYLEDIQGVKHVIAVSTINEYDNTSFYVLGYYTSNAIYESGHYVINIVLGEFVVFFILLLVLLIIVFTQEIRFKVHPPTPANEISTELDCPTRMKFEKTAGAILDNHKGTTFAVCVLDINHYEYMLEQMGQDMIVAVLKHIKTVINKVLELDEAMGYLENGRFVLLLHYRDISTIKDRLGVITSVVRQYTNKSTFKYPFEIVGGIYTTDTSVTSIVGKMVDLAIDAEKTTQFTYDFGTFRIYNQTQYNSSVQNDYIELHMDSALVNHDFKVFYQAKYNIVENRVDGCEALVRWWNSEINEYMQPGVFLPLFEANRFIIKLDHYVFEQVCIYIKQQMENDMPMVPVSVNASRMTATEADFVSFYVGLKKKYNIADNFITIEFTESFAFEDYQMLRQIVTELHKNGFKCSIDDFGSGFSSYNILKELPMDEIKLDRFFIKNGYSNDRDMVILESVIKLGKDLHMKVTQEGVEHKEEVEMLRKLGCHVIQGYLYSKPLALTDYITFLKEKKKL